MNQAWVIARAQIARREHWSEGKRGRGHIIHGVEYRAVPIDDGGWKVIAHRALTEDRGEVGTGWDGPAAIIIINREGVVTKHYREFTSE